MNEAQEMHDLFDEPYQFDMIEDLHMIERQEMLPEEVELIDQREVEDT